MSRAYHVFSVLVVATLVFAACATSSEVSRGGSIVGQFPTGKFVGEKGDYWGFEFDESGDWRGYQYGNLIISGKYATNGNLYTEMTHDYEGSPKLPATYYWTFDGKKLTFKLWGIDENPHRRSVYDGQTYIKVK